MKASPDLIRQWQQVPQAQVCVIVHVQGDPRQYVGAIGRLGLSVIRAFRLTNTIAAHGLACCALDLLNESWVRKVEPDQTITTMA